ncbi:MerR family transcriptional regulator [Microbacterium azadirachtae]|uniref:MerR family transcriptional regulator n=1 Tax=Microbacterium azadirachtae TaxID=582680 RepID=UPI0021D4C369|nr:MerR family transcriptional regulator [Microbacterium azadirachtae]UXW85422.1 MerR family transcriptional regulator [Microbacterium azadirachtae]
MAERDSATPVYGIAVAAELADMNAASLRLLEQKGLLTPARSDGGTRRYSDDDVARLQRVARLRDEGMNIAGIGRVLALEDENAGLRGELEAERAESEALRQREARRG